jgi:UPF0291 protein closa_2061
MISKKGEEFMKQEDIDRINELARKQRAEGLSEEEKKEQDKLRKAYLKAIRNNLTASLNNISILETDGSITDLGKKYGGEV